MRRHIVSISFLVGLGACAGTTENPAQEDGLELRAQPATVQGRFTRRGTNVTYRVAAAPTGRAATAHFDIHGIPLDVTVDLEAQSVVEDAFGSRFELGDRALLLALRDALLVQQPRLGESLEGRLLIKIAERYAEVPVGVPRARHVATAARSGPIDVVGGCGADHTNCLPGTHGTSWAIFSAGGACKAVRTPYGDSSCLGRCGAGCSFWDEDYTYDCLDHDVCLSYSDDCSDEFDDAADDWVVTFGPYCSSGTTRPDPKPRESTLRVRAYVDGRSDLLLRGSSVQWHHFDWAAPGLWGGANEPTYLNSMPWTPVWPSPGENVHCNCDSGLSPPVPTLPSRDQTVMLMVLRGRTPGGAVIKEQPTAANGYTLRVAFDDAAGGAFFHEIGLTYATQ